jgi:hypothetical protein
VFVAHASTIKCLRLPTEAAWLLKVYSCVASNMARRRAVGEKPLRELKAGGKLFKTVYIACIASLASSFLALFGFCALLCIRIFDYMRATCISLFCWPFFGKISFAVCRHNKKKREDAHPPSLPIILSASKTVYSLRVFPAVTRLTVYRWLEVRVLCAIFVNKQFVADRARERPVTEGPSLPITKRGFVAKRTSSVRIYDGMPLFLS